MFRRTIWLRRPTIWNTPMARQILGIIALLSGMVFLMLGGGLQGIVIPVRGQIEGFSAFQLGWIGTGWAVGCGKWMG